MADVINDLTPAQSKVIRYFQTNPTLTLTLSTDQLAERLGVSSASVIRSAQSLGYAGLPELKRDLAVEISHKGVSPGTQWEERLYQNGKAPNRLFDLLGETIGLLEEGIAAIDATTWARAANRLASSTRTFAYGFEEAGHVADFLAHELRSFGFDAIANNATGLSFAPFASLIRNADCVVVICPLRIIPEVKELLRITHEAGVDTIVITETVDLSFAHESSIVLQTPSTVLRNSSNVILPLLVASSLAQEAAAAAPSTAVAAYNEMLDRRDRL
ncbi:MurR/RpiR family transcriptional regulator [Leucobacter sp. HY1908]